MNRGPALVILAVVVACSAEATTPPASAAAAPSQDGDAAASPDASAGDALPSSDAGSAASCTSLTLGGAELVTPENKAGEPPLPKGGVLIDGVYELVTADIYGNATSNPLRAVLSVSGNTIERITTYPPEPPILERLSVVVSGTKMILSTVCGDEPDATVGYSATPKELVRIVKVGAVTLVGTYAKR